MRSRWLAIAAVVALGAALIGSAAPAWLAVDAATAISRETLAVAGSRAVAAVPAAGLVLVVAGLALALAGRAARMVTAVVVAAGVLVMVVTAGFLADPEPAAIAAVARGTGVRPVEASPALTAWPAVALALGATAVTVGVLVATARGGWPATGGRRYETPHASPPTAVPETRDEAGGETGRTGRPPASSESDQSPGVSAVDDWDALSRGEDPT